MKKYSIKIKNVFIIRFLKCINWKKFFLCTLIFPIALLFVGFVFGKPNDTWWYMIPILTGLFDILILNLILKSFVDKSV